MLIFIKDAIRKDHPALSVLALGLYKEPPDCVFWAHSAVVCTAKPWYLQKHYADQTTLLLPVRLQLVHA